MSGGQWWYIVEWYLAPKYSSTIEDVVLAIIQQPRGDALLATGNINVNLEAPEVQVREKEIMETLSAVGLNEISGNFLPPVHVMV